MKWAILYAFSAICASAVTIGTLVIIGEPVVFPVGIYVSSVSGSDTNAGTGSAPFATLAKAMASVSGSTNIYLAAGSMWRERLQITNHNTSVSVYGSGARPLIDSSNQITNTAWTLADGYTNVYQATVSWEVVASAWFGLWNNSNRVARAATLAQCATNPGSHFPSSDSSSPITLYVNSTNGSPSTNGVVYEYTARANGIDALPSSGYTNITVRGLWTRRNGNNDGSIRLHGNIYDHLATDGGKHLILIAGGSYLENCVASNAYYPDGGAFFIANDNTSTANVTYTNCAAYNDAGPTSYQVAFDGHINVSGGYENFYFYDCKARNFNAGIVMSAAKTVVVGGWFSNNNNHVSGNSATVCVTNILTGGTGSVALQNNSATSTNILFGSTIYAPTFTGVFSPTGADFLVVSNNFIGGYDAQTAYTNTAIFTSYGNVFTGTTPFNMMATNQVTSDFNTYAVASKFRADGQGWPNGGYGNFTEWKTATGQDANSVEQ